MMWQPPRLSVGAPRGDAERATPQKTEVRHDIYPVNSEKAMFL